jgi:nucleotide-binding universal stress UspA family protein
MDLRAPVLVAFDGSPDAHCGLLWAAELAETAGAPLRVVIARGDLYTLSDWADDWTAGLAAEWEADAGKLLADHGFHPAEIVVLDGRPAEALVRASAGGSLLVIGSRGHGSVAGLVIGSVSQHVVRHAECPVVVARPAADPESIRVVVGVDGSRASLDALEIALTLASRRRWRVHTVHAREHPTDGPIAEAREIQAEIERVERAVEEAVAAAGARHPDVVLTSERTGTHPTRALVDASMSARLVVVGSRGRGAFAGLLLGSVSTEVTRLAQSPVLIVR